MSTHTYALPPPSYYYSILTTVPQPVLRSLTLSIFVNGILSLILVSKSCCSNFAVLVIQAFLVYIQ